MVQDQGTHDPQQVLGGLQNQENTLTLRKPLESLFFSGGRWAWGAGRMVYWQWGPWEAAPRVTGSGWVGGSGRVSTTLSDTTGRISVDVLVCLKIATDPSDFSF